MAFKNLLLGLALLSGGALAQNTLRTNDDQQALGTNAPRNYIKNSGVEKNDLNISDPFSIASRTTSTPLEGDASLLIDATAAPEVVAFEALPIQPGLIGQTCEATFNYIGDASLYTAYILRNSTVVSDTITLSNSGTNSQPVSLVFPCGTSTSDIPYVAIVATGNGAAIKVDSVYYGKALSIGTVAQEQVIVSANRITSNQTIASGAATQVIFNGENRDTFSEYNSTTGLFTSTRARDLLISSGLYTDNVTSGQNTAVVVYKNGAQANCAGANRSSGASEGAVVSSCLVSVGVGDTVAIYVDAGTDAAYDVIFDPLTYLTIESVPTSSQLVLRGNVTNVAVDASGTPTGSLSGASATIWGTENRDTTGSYNPTTGEFTSPINGDICWAAGILESGTETLDASLSLSPYVNGVALGRGRGLTRAPGSVASLQVQSNGCTYLTIGQVLTFRTDSSITGVGFIAGVGENYLFIQNASQGVPKPFIPGSVFSPYAGIENVTRATLNCSGSSSIASQGGSWIASVGNISSGACAVTFTGSPFSSANYSCAATTTASSTSSFQLMKMSAKTTSGFTMTWLIQNAGSTAASTVSDFDIVCAGPKS